MTKQKNINYLLDFSHVYDDEGKGADDVLWVDCSDITECDMYCSQAAEETIGERIDRFGIHGIHYIDSGNYHYVTKIMTDRIDRPFSLVVFDHHTDMQNAMINGMMSCGDWAGIVLERNRYLRQLVLIGPCDKDIQSIRVKNKDKLITFSEEELHNGTGREKIKQIDKDVPVYISIDKDVLGRDISITNWSQGDMSLELLEHLLKPVLLHEQVLGIDICGECSHGMALLQYMEAEEINGKLNRELYDFLRRNLTI